MSKDEQEERVGLGETPAMRIDIEKAHQLTGDIYWYDRKLGKRLANPTAHGDVVLARKDTNTSYHLSVTLDDDAQGVNLVTRGKDLILATDIHRTLQELLGLNVPEYLHHSLIIGPSGHRLSKRNRPKNIRNYKESGLTSKNIFEMLKKMNSQ